MSATIAQPMRTARVEVREAGLAITHQRLMIVMLLFIMAIMMVVGKLASFGLHGLFHNDAPVSSSFTPARADIVDRNGEVLARDIEAWSIGVHPDQLLSDPEELAPKLAKLMPERTVAQYLQILRGHEKFTYLRRRALPELVAQVNALGEPAMDYLREPQRLYPQTTLAAHVLGYTDFNGNGVAGMERALNTRLSDPAQRNAPASLSIDSRVQAILESELAAGMTQQRALGAAGLVMDANTGEVLAMASLPVFNPNISGQTTDDARRNNMTQSVYELGSTFKPLTFGNAIDTGTVTNIAKRWDATAPLKVGAFTIHDDEPAGRWLNMPEALIHSSNIVAAQISDLVGQQKTAAFFDRLHFNEPPRIELHEKGRPLWPKFWARTTVMTVGFGHGMAVTPLQLATGYAALANGGILRSPTLLKLDPNQVPKGERVFSASTSLLMRKMLRLVVLQGTGGKANVEGMRVGGKTGTAEVPGKHGYNKHANVSTFVCMFPMDAPRYVVLTMLDQPKGSAESGGATTGGMVSAPIAGQVIARIGPMLGIMPDMNRDIDVSDMLPLIWHAKGDRQH